MNVRGKVFPPIQRIRSAADLANIQFVDDMAEIEVPVENLHLLPLKNDARQDSGRLRQLIRAIRKNGYSSVEPVIVRLGRRGRWVVVDGGHRVTAAQQVSKEFFTNLFGPKVQNLYFLLYRTERSEDGIDNPESDPEADEDQVQ